MGRAEKGTIALIDDNEDNRFMFRTWLEEQYNVVEFSEGQNAIIGMKECKPDWVFLDISLPGIDGIEVLRCIRSDDDLRQIPVFALTAHAGIGDRERFLALGFDDYVGKPILDLRTLTNVIENAARKAAAGSKLVHSTSPSSTVIGREPVSGETQNTLKFRQLGR